MRFTRIIEITDKNYGRQIGNNATRISTLNAMKDNE